MNCACSSSVLNFPLVSVEDIPASIQSQQVVFFFPGEVSLPAQYIIINFIPPNGNILIGLFCMLLKIKQKIASEN